MKKTPTLKYIFGILLLIICMQSISAIDRNNVICYTDIDGLPRNIITCVDQDNYGYTWIGTINGVARFDGNNFTTYKTLEGVDVNSILVDHNNQVWVASDDALYGLNRLTNEFEIKIDSYCKKVFTYKKTLYMVEKSRVCTIIGDEFTEVLSVDAGLRDFHIDEKGIWLSSSNKGVLFYDKRNNYQTPTKNLLKGKKVIVIRRIDNKIFFACRNGQVFVLNENNELEEIELNASPLVMEIIKVDNQIWIATDGDGILVLDQNYNYLKSIQKNSNLSTQINTNSIYDLYVGRNNEVWVATYSAGLFCLQKNNSPFKNIVHDVRNSNSLVDKEGTAICLMDDKIMLGTSYGMSVLDEGTGLFTNYSMDFFNERLHDTKALAIKNDHDDNIWIGTYGGLLGKFNKDMALLNTYHPCSESADDMQQIFLIHNYNKNCLLIATYYQWHNLINFNPKTGESTPILLPKKFGNKHKSFKVNSIRENRNGETLVLIKDFGLFAVNIEDNMMINKYPEINSRVTFELNDFYQDPQGLYWFATQKDGLVRMSTDGLSFDKWGSAQGLPSQSLLRIESVDDRYLWISTISGICRFDKQTEQTLIFDHRHNLPVKEFTQRTSETTEDGRIIFGSIAGFTIVNPDKVEADTSNSKVIISDITFHNKSIRSKENMPQINQPLEETKHLKLPFKRNSFTIHFFTKNVELPQYNNYAYRLTNLENEWIYLGENRHTTYTNLSPDTYTFEVKSTNKSNIWSTSPTLLTITITPPWYSTWYAYLAYVLISSLLLFVLLYTYTQRIKLRKEIDMSDYKVQQEQELSERKLIFFTNISHDLKTPLTLIDAPVNELLEDETISDNQKKKLLIIKYNSQRLFKLVSDILDFRKLTQKQIPLKVSEVKIAGIIENIHKSFNAECTKKDIEFQINVSNQELMFVELRKIEKILWNLVSNAVKFTEHEGEIYLSAESEVINEKHFLKLIVKDSGIGIPENETTNIFKRFYQKREGDKIISEGTGIGLSIVKDLVELHHGTISVTSAEGIGSTFTILIPTEKEEYAEDEITIQEIQIKDQADVALSYEASETPIAINKQYSLPVLLLVEDNNELREYLADYFSKKYKVYEAADGAEGVEMVKSKKPDMIVTDIMMPNMNGYDFCKAIRGNFDTSHLPIIMLTANSLVDQQIEGLSVGADAYIAKPFDIKYLDTLIHSVLENRKAIRNRFLGSSDKVDDDNKLTAKDVEFIENLKLFIHENLSNEALSVDLLTTHFSTSRTQLNRKIKSLTGQTPNNLIKSVRLKKAYELINDEGLRVAEAAYQTGFSDPNYFTVCFKKEFGTNPSKL